MLQVLLTLIISTIAVFVTAIFCQGCIWLVLGMALIVAVVLAIINTLIRPLIFSPTLPNQHPDIRVVHFCHHRGIGTSGGLHCAGLSGGRLLVGASFCFGAGYHQRLFKLAGLK